MVSQTALITIMGAFWKKSSKELVTSDTHLIFGKEALPWATIQKIYIKQSALGNRYMSVYFSNGSAPQSFDLEKILDREDLIRYVEAYAKIKGYDFTRELP